MAGSASMITMKRMINSRMAEEEAKRPRILRYLSKLLTKKRRVKHHQTKVLKDKEKQKSWVRRNILFFPQPFIMGANY